MLFCISINIALATVAMEGIYDRLCWIYVTVITVNTLVYDQFGNTYHLSELTKLSEGRIPYPSFEGATMDVITPGHSEIGTQNAMTEVTNHIKMLSNLTGRSEHFRQSVISVLNI
jgi:hypothetical protein